MYRYIGNKTKLLPYIIERTSELIGDHGKVADIMAGTGLVSLEYRKKGYTVTASDMMTYSYHHLNVNLLLDKEPEFDVLLHREKQINLVDNPYLSVLMYLNGLEPSKSFFYREFSPEGTPKEDSNPRKYFTSYNAGKIDSIREKINEWKSEQMISPMEESLLKHTLIMAVNEIANISGTYGYFLAEFKKNALDKLELKPADIYNKNSKGHTVLLGFAEDLASNISADLCYIDPPYMKRQYAANYHILETIARGDYPDAIGKSGLRDWWDQHSKLCTKTKGLQSFEKIIGEMNCDKFLISYSEDGLFKLEELESCFKKFGHVEVKKIDYNRFRSNNSKLPKSLKEYLISIERR